MDRSWSTAAEHCERTGKHMGDFTRIKNRVAEDRALGRQVALRRQFVQATNPHTQLAGLINT